MPNTPQRGHVLVLEFTPSGGDMIELTVYGRNFERNSEVNDIVTTTYAESKLDYHTYIPGLIDSDADIEIVYQAGDDDLYEAITAGVAGSFSYYREGKGTGLPKEVRAGYIKSSGEAFPYEDVVTQPVTIKFSGVPTFSVQV